MGQRVPHILRAHPRSRGEHLSPVWWNSCTVGSSPLARGTRLHIERHALGHGLIPARAGNTPLCVRWACPSWAHPRSRGEHTSAAAGSSPVRGSSPLARGTLLTIFDGLKAVGLIPARAGNTRSFTDSLSLRRAHPRSRGEHRRKSPIPPHKLGSSPLARGTRTQELPVVTVAGLIPARAGNTRSSHGHHRVDGAHPRSRGEHRCASRCRLVWLGSSPLARGTLFQQTGQLVTLGLIPARAGNTRCESVQVIPGGAHPRSRGEHRRSNLARSSTWGSSPLARGTHFSHSIICMVSGLIPARAGNTVRIKTGYAGKRAHPRSRGEHQFLRSQRPRSLGSSPLARGTHLLTWDFTPYISKIESLWNQSLHPEYTISSHY